MAKLLLIIGAVFACGFAPGLAQPFDWQAAPPARLIKPRPGPPARPELRPPEMRPPEMRPPEMRPVERPRPFPLDDRCRPLKEQLEFELQRAGAVRRAFQARLAHNAGSRLCREGHPEMGIAEFERGLSYLQQGPRY